jgi:phosphotransferase system enzyme I (PtsI)
MEKTSKEQAEIFEAHLLLLEDPMFLEGIESRISDQQLSAEQAVQETTAEIASMFESLEDEYIRARAADIQDIGRRICRNLSGESTDMTPGGIWVATELLPSEVGSAPEMEVAALACDAGALNSHAAILARSLEIPAVFGIKDLTRQIKDGEILIVDGDAGIVILNPDEATLVEYQQKANSESKEEPLAALRGKIKPGSIKVKANLGSVEDAVRAFEAGADGAGIVRTEFLFADRDQMPSEEEQYQVYRAILKAANGKPVTVRTLDAGSDKPLSYIQTPEETNPALGLRGLRLSLTMPEVFKAQLKAIIRAAAEGDAQILFPMVTNVDEMNQGIALVHESMKELKEQGVSIGSPRIGAMIEVPAAAINAIAIAERAEFMSIGTNDLVQYTLATDRINSAVAHLYNELDPAVIELIRMVLKAGRKYKRPVSVCGEMAANLKALPCLLEIGVREVSMSPAFIPKIKAALRSLSEPA